MSRAKGAAAGHRDRAGFWRHVVVTSAAAAMFGALIEALVRLLQGWRKLGDPVPFHPDAVWLVPFVTLVLLVPVVALAGAVPLVMRRPRAMLFAMRTVAWSVASYQALHGSLVRIHPVAAALLMIGLGAQAARLLERPQRRRVVAWGTVAIAVAAVIGAATVTAARTRGFQRILSDLPQPATGAPNVLLLILDTVGANAMSLYGYAHRTTPQIDSIARQGIVFDRAVAPAPWTLPTHASMFTGRDPRALSARYLVPLDDRVPVLAERFAAAGYATGGFVANLEYAGAHSGLARGFHWYGDASPALPAAVQSSVLGRRYVALLKRVSRRPLYLARKSAGQVNREFLDWRNRADDRPWFAFLNYYDAHAPYIPPRRLERLFLSPGDTLVHDVEALDPRDGPAVRGARAAYDASILALDAAVGALLRDLERRGDLERTLVIISSDHGEEFGEHGLLEHGLSLYLQALHVPLVVLPPGGQVAPRRVPTVVSTTRVAATALALAGVRPGGIGGASLAPLWKEGRRAEAVEPVHSWVERAIRRDPSFPASQRELFSVIVDSLHLIRGPTLEIYDILKDPEETRNLSGNVGPIPQLAILRDSTPMP